MLKCERCTVFLLDLKIYEEVYCNMIIMMKVMIMIRFQLEEEAWQVKDFLSQPSLNSNASTRLIVMVDGRK